MKLIKLSSTLLLFGLGANSVNAQSTFTDWIADGQPELSQNEPDTPNVPSGGLTVYNDLASLQAAVGTSHPIETFESGMVGAGGVVTCGEPVNSASNDSCYTTGSLIPGFNITSSTATGVVILGTGVVANTSIVIGANTFLDTTLVSFDNSDVYSIGLDVISGGAVPITVTALDASSNTIGAVTVNTTAAGVPEFVGFISATAVASIIISDDTGGGELFDNLTFGPVGPLAPPPVVPVFNNFTLMALLLLMAALTWKFGFRRNN